MVAPFMANLFQKVAWITDTHFGRSGNSPMASQDTLEFMDWALERAQSWGAETMIFGGDYFDNRNTIGVLTLNYALEGLEKINKSFKKTYILSGNHDLPYREKREFSSVEIARNLPNIELIRNPTTIGDVTMLPWLVGDEPKKVKHLKSRYVFGHLEMPNFKMNANVILPDNPNLLQADQFLNQEHVFCFPGEVTIVCSDGVKPISTVKIGDKVLTHKGRWKPVIGVLKNQSQLIRLKGTGHPGLPVTPNHPFLSYGNEQCITKGRGIRKLNQIVVGNVGEDRWVDAESMLHHWWCSPAKITVEEKSIPTDFEMSPTFCHFLGWFLAEGHTSNNRIYLSCHVDEVEMLKNIMETLKESIYPSTIIRPGRPSKGEIGVSQTSEGNGRQIGLFHSRLANWLDIHFGKGCEHKTIPGWVFMLSDNCRTAFLNGYVSGDGHMLSEDKWESKSISRGITFGIKILAQTLGWKTTLFARKATRNMAFPGGRRYDCAMQWHLRAYRKTARWGSTIFVDDFLCGNVKKVTYETGVHDVYNLTVDEDNSYVADGIVVHNCGHFHIRQNTGKIIYTGAALAQNFSDAWDDNKGLMLLEWGKEPLFESWHEQPVYRTTKLSDLLENPGKVLRPKATIRAVMDVTLHYEEMQEIRDALQTEYGVRKFEIIPMATTDESEQSFKDERITFKSVDQMVIDGIMSVESETLDKQRLAEIYRSLAE